MARVDNEWHHIAITWEFDTGKTSLMFDGTPAVPYWGRNGEQTNVKLPSDGGVPPIMAPQTWRYWDGWPHWQLSMQVWCTAAHAASQPGCMRSKLLRSGGVSIQPQTPMSCLALCLGVSVNAAEYHGAACQPQSHWLDSISMLAHRIRMAHLKVDSPS